MRYTAYCEKRYSSTGECIGEVWKFMPRVGDSVLRSVVYLYPSVEAAEKGVAIGGTGFLLGMPSETHRGRVHYYALTNYHVVNDAPIIRFNLQNGSTRVVKLTADNWIRHTDGDDLVVTYLGFFDDTNLAHSAIMLYGCLSREEATIHDIGPGDDVIVPTRFITWDGSQRNEPCIRSGIISLIPSGLIPDQHGHLQETILVEVRALRGSSGSPVFVQIRASDRRETKQFEELRRKIYYEDYRPRQEEFIKACGEDRTWLLGIAFEDYPYDEPVVFRKENGKGQVKETPSHYIAQSNSGQMAVIPAWRIRDFLLHDERFIMAREAKDKELQEEKKRGPGRQIAQNPKSEPVLEKETFEDILKRVSRKTYEPES
jgi:hypothetical protein